MDIPDQDSEEILRDLILESELEITKSGISVTDAEEKIVYWNKRFLKIWELTEKDVANKPRTSLAEQVINRIENSEKFMEILNSAYSNRKYQGTDFVRFKSGVTIERKTIALQKDGKYYGRIWYFNDLTKQMQREKEMEI